MSATVAEFYNRYGVQATRTPTHIYLTPHPGLRPFIAHYTLCLDNGSAAQVAPETLTLIPDASGCFVFTFWDQDWDARVYGPTTQTVTVENDLGRCPPRLFVEFRPGGLFALTGIPQDQLRDRVWPLHDICPALYRLVLAAREASADLDELVRLVDRGLGAHISAPTPVQPMLAWLARSRENLPVAALSAETGYSPRHLSRLFTEGVGMGAKSFARVLRVNEAVRRVQVPSLSLTALAQDLGYYDQAHFIHDFKSICRVSPSEYRAALSDFYNEPLKF